MNQSTIYDSLTQPLMNTPGYNAFDTAFGIASTFYPEAQSGPGSPSCSHSHDDMTGDESGDLSPPKARHSANPRTQQSRHRKPANRKAVQPEDQIVKRRIQNRAAQRSFRERQKEYVHDLENRIEHLKGEISMLNENYQELLKVVTAAPRIPQWNADLSPATLVDDLEYGGSGGGGRDGLEPVKVEEAYYPRGMNRDYHGILFA